MEVNQPFTPEIPLPVIDGGTGVSSFTPYAIITGGITSTSPLQQVSGLGTSFQILTSNGSSTLPTWQTITSNTDLTNYLVGNYLKLDQTTPQTVINGTPVFNAGIKSNALTVIDLNTVDGPAHLNGTGLALVGADNSMVRFGISSFGLAGMGAYAQRHARGTAALPSAVQSGDVLMSLEGWGYGATGYSVSARAFIRGYAGQTWSDSDQETYLSAWVTSHNSLVPVEAVRILSDKTLKFFGYPTAGFLKTDATGVVSVDTNIYALASSLSNYLLASGATTGATSQAQAFTNGVITEKIYPSVDSTSAFGLFKAGGTTNILNLDTTNARMQVYSPNTSMSGDMAGVTQANFAVMSNDPVATGKGGVLGLGGVYNGGGAYLMFGAIKGAKNADNSGDLILYSYKGGVGLTEGARLTSDGFFQTSVSTLKTLSTAEPTALYYIYSKTDPVNPTVSAMFIQPGFNQRRLFLGDTGQHWYSVNFSNVENFESVPSIRYSKPNGLEWGDVNDQLKVYDNFNPTGSYTRNNTMLFQVFDDTNGGDFDFRGSNATFPWLYMRDSKVGIGTALPAYRLNVSSDTNIPTFGLFGTNNSGYAIADIGAQYYGINLALNNATSSYYALNIVTGATITTTGWSGGTSILRIRNDGNIGINTTAPNSKLHVNGSFAGAYRAITALRTLDETDYQIECTANSFTITLPTAVGITGRIYSIKNTGTGIITIATTSSQTIDGNLTQIINQWDNIQLMSNGSNWIIL